MEARMETILLGVKKPLSILIWLVIMVCSLPLVAAQDTAIDGQLLGFNVSYGGKVYDSVTNQTTFSYMVVGASAPHDLSHFDIGIPSCTPPLLIASTSPTQAISFGVDPTTGVDGIKWDTSLSTTDSRTYSIGFIGNVAEGSVQVAVKASNEFEIANLPGPSCEVVSIDVDKFVTVDGVTWENADDAPGPQYQAGDQVSFKFVISNIGNVELANLSLTDSVYDTSGCSLPPTLAVSALTECTIGSFAAVDGPHENIATASAIVGGVSVSATDTAYYFTGNLPDVQIDKTISKDGGGTWADSIRVANGRDVFYKLVVTNIGNVTLSAITLVDDTHSTQSCILPGILNAGEAYECVVGPFPAGNQDYTNTASVSANFEGATVSDSDTASYRATDNDSSGVVIIIEGPIDLIVGNIITIFGLNIEIDPNNTILTTIHIGDIIRIEGDLLENGDTIIVIAVVVVVIDIDIILTGSPGGPIYVPYGCKLSRNGNSNNFKLKCKKRKKTT